MKKFLTKLLLIGVTLVVIAFLARNVIARKSVEIGVKKVTGFPMEIDSVSLQLFSSKLDVRNVRLTNPPEFEDKSFVDLPRLYIDYNLGSMIFRKPHINEMILDVNELVIVKNAQGETNAMKLKGMLASNDEAKSDDDDETSMEYKVDSFTVHVGTVRFLDYSRGKLRERNLPLNIDATYKNITDSSDIPRLVLLTVLSKAGIPDVGIDMTKLREGIGNVQDAAGEAIKGTIEGVEKAGKGLFDSIKKAIPEKN